MTSFKNLVFISHPNTFTEGIMAKYRFDNGKEISIVAGKNLYSISKDGVKAAVSNPDDVSDFEVMFDGQVMGYQTREDINEIFKANA